MKIQNGDNEVCNRSLSEMFDIDMKNIYAVMQEKERKNHAFEMARHPVCLSESYDDTIELRGCTNDTFSILVSEMSELCLQENGINSLNHQFVHDKELQNSLHDQTCKMSAETYQRKILNDPNVPVEWMSVSKDTIEFNDFFKKISLQHIQKEPKPQEKENSCITKINSLPSRPSLFNDFVKKISLQHIQKEPTPQEIENSCITKINSLPSRSSFLDFGLIDSFVKEKVLLQRQCYQKTLMAKGNFRILIQGENTKLSHMPSPLPDLPSKKSNSIFRVFQIAGLQLRRLVHAIAQIFEKFFSLIKVLVHAIAQIFEKFFSLIKVLVQILELPVRRITNIVKERQIYSQKMSTLLIHAQLNDKPV